MPADQTDELKLLIRSRHPVVSIETADEDRALALVYRVAKDMDQPLFEWSVTKGLSRRVPTVGHMIANTQSPKGALSYAQDVTVRGVFVFKDLSPHLIDASLARQLHDVYSVFSNRKSTLILIEGAASVPDNLRRLTVPFDVKWPTAEELEEVVRDTLREAQLIDRAKVTLDPSQMQRMVGNLRGLTRKEAARVVASAVYDDNVLSADDLPKITTAKREILTSRGILDPVQVDVTPDDLGGLTRLKAWLGRRREGFSPQAREFGLTPPRGILLLGVQGCGKSLCAKVVASFFQMPLLRLDPGTLYRKWVGETESRLRQALSQAEVISPVVLWIDEIEKALASAASASADGGLSQRVFGTLLSWMQEHKQPVFSVATANDVSRLPPELLRKGRFDEVFFVDLPDAAAREQVFAIHIRRRRRNPDDFDLKRLAAASEGFGGAEIEQVVIAALYAAFAEKTDIDDEKLFAELAATRPLSVLMAERIAELRAWARDRCVPAG